MKNVRKKVYDKTCKGYVTAIDMNSASSISIPKEEKKGLCIVLPFIVFQIFIPVGKLINIEFIIQGEKYDRRRIFFGRGSKQIIKSDHHSNVPS